MQSQGAMKVGYNLYESLIDLAINLGCTYLEEYVSARANYRSKTIVREFIELLSSRVEQDIITKIKSSTYSILLL